MVFTRPGDEADAPVSIKAESSPAGAVPLPRDADGEAGSHEGSTTGESHSLQRMDAAPPSTERLMDASYPPAPGEHDLGTAQAMLSFVLIVVTVTVACVLVILVTRYSKDHRAAFRVEAHRSPPSKTSWPPIIRH
ncbi:uncharacterized protein LOC125939931 [Dermacentor silvarum]|uniref:uncharacterized protein LOC125939931 n=1 Tax=Dermacentor silvarum TaxID=543639 RepID=UPI0021017FD3|nr:uncharacterized protein LOC125939931 [Dermacentor silvarum]